LLKGRGAKKMPRKKTDFQTGGSRRFSVWRCQPLKLQHYFRTQ